MNDAVRRLDKLEKQLAVGAEIEDLTEADLEVYGLEAVKEIYEVAGIPGLQALLYRSDLSGESKIIIADFISRNVK